MREALTTLLRARFGDIDDSTANRIATATYAELKAAFARATVASGLEGLFAASD